MPDIQRSFAVTPDGAAVLGLRKSQRDHTRTLLTRWSVPNGAVTWSRPVGRSYGPLALSDDGARVAILTQTPGGVGGAWVVADATTGAELRRYDTTGNIEFDLAADFVPGTHTLVTSRREGATEAFPGDGGEPRTLPLAGEQTWRGGLSVDGALGVNRGGVVFTLDQGEEVARLGDVAEDRNLFSNLRAVAFSPDGTELAVVGRSIVRFHLRPGRQLLPEEDRAASVHGVFLASGDLVVQGPDQRLERWAPPYREGTSFGPPLRVRTPMGRGQRPGTVTAWSRSAWIRAASGKQASTTLARPPGGSYQWLLARHAEVLIQPPTEGSEHFLVMDAGDDEPRRVAVEGSFRHAATSELSDDGRYLVSVGATDLYLWDTGTGELLHHMPQAFAGGLVPGSQDLFWYRPASHIQGGGRSSGGPRQLWRVGAEAPLREFPGSGELAYVPGYDRLVGIVDVQGGLQFQPLSGDTSYETEDLELRHVRQVVVSDDGAALVTIHQDGTAYLWDTVNLLRNAGDPSTSR